MKEISILFTHHERGRENEFTRGFKSLTFGFYDLKVDLRALIRASLMSQDIRSVYIRTLLRSELWLSVMFENR